MVRLQGKVPGWCGGLSEGSVSPQQSSFRQPTAPVVKGGLEQRDLRQREEMRLIFKFRTLAPLGINRDFSFL